MIAVSNNVHRKKYIYDPHDFEAWVLLISDLHLDNPDCKTEILTDLLEEAKKRSATIIMPGDIFCAMQGRNDPRRSKKQVRGNQKTAYFDDLVKEGKDLLLPYAHNIAIMGRGNHEDAVLKNNETDLVQRLADLLNVIADPPHPIAAPGIAGYVLFQFQREGSNYRQSFKLKYHHGTGRKRAFRELYPDADIIYSGHYHDRRVDTYSRERINRNGKLYTHEQVHLHGGTFKDSWKDGSAGYDVDRQYGPPSIGGWWVRFFVKKYNRENHSYPVDFEYMPTR